MDPASLRTPLVCFQHLYRSYDCGDKIGTPGARSAIFRLTSTFAFDGSYDIIDVIPEPIRKGRGWPRARKAEWPCWLAPGMRLAPPWRGDSPPPAIPSAWRGAMPRSLGV